MSGFFFKHNADYGTGRKIAHFQCFGTFLGLKILKNGEKWQNIAFHFFNDPNC